MDGNESHEAVLRCDYGSDVSLVCRTIAEPAALNEIGRVQKIPEVEIKVALEKEGFESEFTF